MRSHRMTRTGRTGQRDALATLPKRSLSLSGPQMRRLIREALDAGGEIWVTGSGQSMQPTIQHADFVLLSPVPRGARPGDVVLVPLGPGLMLHRVVHVSAAGVTTRGDARQKNDAPTANCDVLARAVAVRRGAVVTPLFLTTRFGYTALLRFLLRDVGRRARLVRAAIRRTITKTSHSG